MATEFHEVLGQSIASPSDLNAVLLQAKDNSIVHIDESHLLKKGISNRTVLGDRSAKTDSQRWKANRIIAHRRLHAFAFSTTDEYCLLQPLRDRMRLILRFEFYSEDELTTVLSHRAKCLHWDIHEEVPPLIARKSRGTPRIALRIFKACYRVCRSLGESTITLDHLKRACHLEQIDELGLGPNEQKYLVDSRQRTAKGERRCLLAWSACTNN